MSSDSKSGLVLHYPQHNDNIVKSKKDSSKLWSEISDMYDGKDLELFETFAKTCHKTLTSQMLYGRDSRSIYQLLRYYFNFFKEDMHSIRQDLPSRYGVNVRTEQPPEDTLASEHKGMAYTNILIHIVDAPFIFENLGGYLNQTEHHVITGTSTTLFTTRKGKKLALHDDSNGTSKEIFAVYQVAKIVNPESIKKLQSEITATLESLFHAVADFHPMTKSVVALSKEISAIKDGSGIEGAEFLRWLVPNSYIFMGMASYNIQKKGRGYSVTKTDGTSLGVFADETLMEIVYPEIQKEIIERIASSISRKHILILDFFLKSPKIIYHTEPVDVVIIRQMDENGNRGKATVLFGRISRGALMSKASSIPLLRKKLSRLTKALELREKSHLHRELILLFNMMPKKELFYIDRQTMTELMQAALDMHSEDEMHLLVRQSQQFGYATAILIFSARKYSQATVKLIQKYFEKELGLEVVYVQSSSSNVVAKVFLYFPLSEKVEKLDPKKIVNDIINITIGWESVLLHLLITEMGDHKAFATFNHYVPRLSDLYKNAVKPIEAVQDLVQLIEVEKTNTIQLQIDKKSDTSATLRLLWDKELNLMKLIPTLNNLGINVKEEVALPLKNCSSNPLYIQLLRVEDSKEKIGSLIANSLLLTEAMQKILASKVQDCMLNRLVLAAGFSWQQVDIIRAYKNYMLQIDSRVNPSTVTKIFIKYPYVTGMAVEFFEEKFGPDGGREKNIELVRTRFNNALRKITDLSEDQVLKLLLNIMENTLRTNFYKEKPSHFISFKVDSAKVMIMPRPKPLAEIYVHTPTLQGVHLRGGRVARGGLRWSDRADDFRTEVLGLMKTQMVKNAVIVPEGSKGGFVIKKLHGETKEEIHADFKENYQTFISGLLDITDNIIDGEIVPPADVRCYDEPDPYLVVAADKGTATMSDAANEMSKKYKFWLKDGFASGGSVGYDHKKFGITARGAWECVKRHFREINIDIQQQPITVAGIGSMDGDVFGNGMLLSKKLMLVAAFSHLHIFLDPNPDPATSWKERERLFKNVLMWDKYDPSLISEGGGVYDRSAKEIPISPEMQKRLQTEKKVMSGQELIRAIITMPVGLLYCGGIGTYIRASTEPSSEVGDKANEAVRVAAKELRAKVIGEGANLAMTQKARIEFDKYGGILNTDSIDNSAGVDISDHEVNLKILLELLLNKGEIANEKERNKLFATLGTEISEMVLQNSYLQSACITMDKHRSKTMMERFANFFDHMENKGLLDREGECIPEKQQLMEYSLKPGHIPRPILSVMMGYEKIRLKKAILSSPIIDNSYVTRYLYGYFPPVIRHDYEMHIKEHRLKSEIIATMIGNKIVNQAGITAIYKLQVKTDSEPWEICRAYLIAENLIDADEFRKMVHKLDNKTAASMQMNILMQQEHLLSQMVAWMLKHMEPDRINFDFISHYQEIIRKFKKNLFEELESICSLQEGCIGEKVRSLKSDNIPEELGQQLVILPYLKDIMSIIHIKEERHTNFIETGNLYILTTTEFELDWIYKTLENFIPETEWEKKMVDNLTRELEQCQNRIVMKILDFKRKKETMESAFANYVKEKDAGFSEYRSTIKKIRTETSNNLTAVTVLIRQMEELL